MEVIRFEGYDGIRDKDDQAVGAIGSCGVVADSDGVDGLLVENHRPSDNDGSFVNYLFN